jgi:hypothetical protein
MNGIASRTCGHIDGAGRGQFRGKIHARLAELEQQRGLPRNSAPQEIIFFSVRELTPGLRFFSVAREGTQMLNEVGTVDS